MTKNKINTYMFYHDITKESKTIKQKTRPSWDFHVVTKYVRGREMRC